MKRTKKVLAGVLSILLAVSVLPMDGYVSYASETQPVIGSEPEATGDNGQAETEEMQSEEIQKSETEETVSEESEAEKGDTEEDDTEEIVSDETEIENAETTVEADNDEEDETQTETDKTEETEPKKDGIQKATLAEGELYKEDFSSYTEGTTKEPPSGWKPQITLNANGTVKETKTAYGEIVKDGDNFYYTYSYPSSTKDDASPYIGVSYKSLISDQYVFSLDFQCEDNATYQFFFNNEAISYEKQAIRIRIETKSGSMAVKAHDGKDYNTALISGQAVSGTDWMTLSLTVDNAVGKYKAVLKKGEQELYTSADALGFSYPTNTIAGESVKAQATAFVVQCPGDKSINMDNISIKETDEKFGSEDDPDKPEDALYWEGFHSSQYSVGDFDKAPNNWTAKSALTASIVNDRTDNNQYYKLSGGSSGDYIGTKYLVPANSAVPDQYIFSFDFKCESNGTYELYFAETVPWTNIAIRMGITKNDNGITITERKNSQKIFESISAPDWMNLSLEIDNVNKTYTAVLTDLSNNQEYNAESTVWNYLNNSYSPSAFTIKYETGVISLDSFYVRKVAESEIPTPETPAVPTQTVYLEDFQDDTYAEGDINRVPDQWAAQNGGTPAAAIVSTAENKYYKLTGSDAPAFIGMKYGDVGVSDLPEKYFFSFDFQCEAAGDYQLFFTDNALGYDKYAIRMKISKDANGKITVQELNGNKKLVNAAEVSGWLNLTLAIDNESHMYTAVLTDLSANKKIYDDAAALSFMSDSNSASAFVLESKSGTAISIDNICIKKEYDRKIFYSEPFDYPNEVDKTEFMPDGWDTKGAQPQVRAIRAHSDQNDDYYYELSRAADYETGQSAYIGKQFTMILPDEFTFSMDIKYEKGKMDLPMYDSGVNGSNLAVRMGIKDGALWVNDGSERTLYKITDNGWMNLSREIDNVNKTYTVTLTDSNGDKLFESEKISFNNKKASAGAFSISLWRGVECKISIDNVLLTGYDIPSTPKPVEVEFPRDGKVHCEEKDDGTWVLCNDYTRVVIDEYSADMTELSRYVEGVNGLKDGLYNLLGNGGRGYYLLNYVLNGTRYAHAVDGAEGEIVEATKTDSFCDLKLVQDHYVADGGSYGNKHYAFSLELHFVLDNTTNGVYMYAYSYIAPDAVLDENVKTLTIEQSRYAFKLDSRLYQYGSAAGRELTLLPDFADYGEKLFDATYRVKDNTGKDDYVYTKYMSNTYQFESQVSGAYGDTFGFSMITPSREWAGGGYAKQDIEVQDSGEDLTRLVNWHFASAHGGTKVADVDKDWKKLYGPILLFADYEESADTKDNALATEEKLLANAKAQTAAEVDAWPYQWVTDAEYAAGTRSAVKGNIQLADTDAGSAKETKSDLSPEGIGWAILSDMRSESWQYDNVYYEFYAPVKTDGSFEITDVRPGTYRLNIDINGVVGEYELENVVVGESETKNLGNLTWDPPVYGKTLWTIGTPDRTAEEFNGGDHYRYWGAHLLFQDRFPEGVNFKVGESIESEDWFTLHMSSPTSGQMSHYDGGYYFDESIGNLRYDPDQATVNIADIWKGTEHTPWNIIFDNKDTYIGGKATLLVAIAGSRSAKLVVKVNDTQIGDAIDLYSSGAYPRCMLVGQYELVTIEFDATLLKQGENVISFSHETPAYAESSSPGDLAAQKDMGPYKNIIYDAVRLDVDGTVKEAGADKSGLQALCDEYAKLKEGDYTADSWKVFADALKAAEGVLAKEDATEEEIIAAKTALENAVNALRHADDSGDDDPEGVLPGDCPEDGKIPDGLWIAGIDVNGYEYTGKAIKPEVRVYDGKQRLRIGQDYTIGYKNNTAASNVSNSKPPTIVVKGKGNYVGTETKTFVIRPVDLNSNGITTENITVVSNNRVQKKVPVVSFNGRKLKKNKDFTVSYPSEGQGAYKDAGTYEIRLEAKNGGNFIGTRTVNLTVIDPAKTTLMSKAAVAKIEDRPYDGGKAVEPELTVTLKKGSTTIRLVKDTDYTVRYENNTEVGTAAVILTGTNQPGNGYAGTKKVTFKITGTSLKGASVTGIENKIYNGSAQEQNGLAVKVDNVLLDKGVHYDVAYINNKNVGKATMTIKGKGKYTGTIKKTFQITAYDLKANSGGKIEVDAADTAKYMKGGSKPAIKLIFAGETLTEGTDYTVSYKNNKTVTADTTAKKPTFTIKGKGNFKGTMEPKGFTIVSKELSDPEVTMFVADKGFVNKAGKYVSAPVLTDADGKRLVAGKDYEKEIVYAGEDGSLLDKTSNPEVNAKITVTVTGKGAYTGTLSGTYSIKEKDFCKVKITIPVQAYTGQEVTFNESSNIIVKDGENLTYGLDYEILEGSYINNVKKGTAKVMFVGKGNYGGAKTVKFKIRAKTFKWF